MQTYWCQVFLLPQKVLKAIQSTCRLFLWTGDVNASRRALVAWERVCLNLQEAGISLTFNVGTKQLLGNCYGTWLRKKTKSGSSGCMATM